MLDKKISLKTVVMILVVIVGSLYLYGFAKAHQVKEQSPLYQKMTYANLNIVSQFGFKSAY